MTTFTNIQFFVLKELFDEIAQHQDSFTRKDFILTAREKKIGKKTCDAFLHYFHKKGYLIRDKRPTGRRGRTPFVFKIISGVKPARCENCINHTISYHCNHCGTKICQHKAINLVHLYLCPDCAQNVLICPSCLAARILEIEENQEQYNKDIDFLIREFQEGEPVWYCPNPHCDIAVTRFSRETILFRLQQNQPDFLLEMKQESEYEREHHEKMLETKEQYQQQQGKLLNSCEYEETCTATCSLEFVEEEDKSVICPNGLIGWDPECDICEDCDYLQSFPALSPYDEEYTDFSCKFFDITSYNEEEIEKNY